MDMPLKPNILDDISKDVGLRLNNRGIVSLFSVELDLCSSAS